MATKSPRTIHVPVKLESSRPVHRRTPAKPAAERTIPPLLAKEGPAGEVRPAPSKLHSIDHAPLAQRRRWMWGLVAAGMLVAVLLWSLSLGTQLRQTDQQRNVLTQVANLFRTFHLKDSTKTDPKQEEIRQLEKQVFPQF